MSPKVSIVIPCFNEETYIEECLDSILAQTYQDFEILCVDNGSTDSTVNILNRYAAVDDRIRVLFSEGNAGDARNVGMDVAQGKYLLFLDSDDFFDEALLAETIEAAEKNEAEVVLFGGRTYDETTGLLAEKMGYISWFRFPEQTVFSAEDVPDRLFQLTTPAPWTKLFLRQHILDLGLRFQSLPNSNDLFFTLSVLSMSTRIMGLERDFIRYRRNKKNSTQSNKANNPLCFFEALKALNDYLILNNRSKLLSNTFKWQILSTTKYNITTSTTDAAKDAIFDYLIANWSGWLELNWSEDAEYTKPPSDIRLSLVCAIAQYKDQQLNHSLISSDLECVIEGKCAQKPIISVIIPCYNTSSFVRETLQSLISQTFAEFEIICIDDGSKDDTLQVLEEYARRDTRISVYRQPNAGQSVARNGGISKAQGEYIYCIDSDDKLLPNTFEILYKEAIDGSLDMVLFDADCFYGVEQNLEEYKKRYGNYYHRKGEYQSVCSGIELMTQMSMKGDYLPSPCLYLVRKTILDKHDIHFIPRVIHEDNAYTFQLMLNASRVKHMPKALYLRRIRDCSTMTSRECFKNVYGYYVCIKQMLESLFMLEGEEGEILLDVYRIITIAMNAARNIYIRLDPAEVDGALALSIDDAKRFNSWIAQSGNNERNAKRLINQQNAKLNKQAKKISWLRKQIKKRDARISAIEGSRSFKLLCKAHPSLKSAGKSSAK